MIAATEQILDQAPEAVTDMLNIIHESCQQFMQLDNNIALVAKRYQQNIRDVERWYHATEWATHGWVSNKMLKSVVHNLKLAEIVSDSATTPELIWRR